MNPGIDEGVAQRLQDEHRVLAQLVQLVREHIARHPGGLDSTWLDALRAAFDRLYAHVARTISMKEQGGYLDSILRVRPTLARQVADARSENGQLLRLADSIRRDLSQAQATERLLVRDVCDRIQRYADHLGQHEQRENMLALFAFNTEFGGD